MWSSIWTVLCIAGRGSSRSQFPFSRGCGGWGSATRLTNNTSRSKVDYVAKLHTLGIDAKPAEIYTPAESVIAYLRRELPGARVLELLGTPSLEREFTAAGFEVTGDEPDAVVVGFDMTLTYERLCRAAYWINVGKPFLATHPDLVCPTDQLTVLVDCGSICACLTAATGRTPIVFGKPDPSILLELCGRLGLAPQQIAMVGDRLSTDVCMAQEAGAFSVLVLSGEATAAEAAAMPVPPDLVVADVGELGARLAAAREASAS